MNSVLTKLMQARINLNNIEIKKSGMNKFANYSYFELQDFLPIIQKIFHELKLAGVVSFGQELAKLTITCTEKNESIVIETPMATASLKGCHDVQNLGAVQTYLRRYLWVTALEIVEHDVLDGGAMEQKEQTKKEQLTPSNIKMWNGAIKAYLRDGNFDSVLNFFEISEVNKTKLIALAKAQKEMEDIPQ